MNVILPKSSFVRVVLKYDREEGVRELCKLMI